MSKKILVIGANGQLGSCLRKRENDYRWDCDFLFTDYDTLDITDIEALERYFGENTPNFCINASAYTVVDLAEKEKEKAFAVNTYGVENLAKTCKIHNTVLIHVSTDYVFDGNTNLPYTEDDFTNPTGVYAESKREGEVLALKNNPETIIVRTSWLYSEFAKNFVKTMLSLFETQKELKVVGDQFGQPTNANDLAEVIMRIIEAPVKTFGVFHYSNYPETNWCEFAQKIAELTHSSIKIHSITTEEYPTPAKRPMRSTMCLDKIREAYDVDLKHWENSLEECLAELKKFPAQ